MIASGLHSGLAIKRQRKRRMDHKRARERRFSTRSNESGFNSSNASPRGSVDGLRSRRKQDTTAGAGFESNVGIGMLHIGVVFAVLGGFLLASGIIPDDLDKFEWSDFLKKSTWWNELVITGVFSILLGVFLVILNKFITKREEEELEDYVSRQLTRSKSGHILVRDLETGNLTTKRSRSSNVVTDDVRRSMVEDIPDVHSPTVKSPPPIYNQSSHVFMNGDTGLLSPQLEKIMEEDASERQMAVQADDYDSTTASLSPGTPSEAQELLSDLPKYNAPVVPSKFHQARISKI